MRGTCKSLLGISTCHLPLSDLVSEPTDEPPYSSSEQQDPEGYSSAQTLGGVAVQEEMVKNQSKLGSRPPTARGRENTPAPADSVTPQGTIVGSARPNYKMTYFSLPTLKAVNG